MIQELNKSGGAGKAKTAGHIWRAALRDAVSLVAWEQICCIPFRMFSHEYLYMEMRSHKVVVVVVLPSECDHISLTNLFSPPALRLKTQLSSCLRGKITVLTRVGLLVSSERVEHVIIAMLGCIRCRPQASACFQLCVFFHETQLSS